MSTVASSTGRLRRGWEYYRRYTKRRTAVHAAATAALTGFGLLATVHRGFIVVAIASYLLPPIYLYLSGDDLDGGGRGGTRADRTARRSAVANRDAATDGADGDADSDGIDLDSDVDGIDADADGVDTDADSDGTDADADTDGVDRDADSDG